MLAGHFGFAAAVKSRAFAVPLWALMLATQWLDVVFVPLVVAGVEHFEPVAGARPGAYGELLIFADYTHSLVGALVLSFLLGAAMAWRYSAKTGLILGAVAFSHWLFDLVVHRADMPILLGGQGHLPRLGFGLWRHPGLCAALELLLVTLGAYLYWRAARSVASGEPVHIRRANLCGLAVLGAGCVTLGLNIAGF